MMQAAMIVLEQQLCTNNLSSSREEDQLLIVYSHPNKHRTVQSLKFISYKAYRIMSASSRIEYSEKYADDAHEYR